ncbi:hypothetical protein PR048_007182 [Dryococelus australis]|uniref:Uncharacterized protein n=1 Tax=Dryococelus australis TaxID=614101 RepID=A0ABQ9ICX1_9NEOP|nr:hypothetical protein PR048_007182 [Dryococelus australis]
MRVKRGEYGAAPKCKDGEEREVAEKTRRDSVIVWYDSAAMRIGIFRMVYVNRASDNYYVAEILVKLVNYVFPADHENWNSAHLCLICRQQIRQRDQGNSERLLDDFQRQRDSAVFGADEGDGVLAWSAAVNRSWEQVRIPAKLKQLKAVHDIENTFEINVRKKSLLLPGYILKAALNDMRPLREGWTSVGTPRPRSRSEGAIRATLTRTPSALIAPTRKACSVSVVTLYCACEPHSERGGIRRSAGFLKDFPFPPPFHSRRCSVLISFHLIGCQDLDKTRYIAEEELPPPPSPPQVKEVTSLDGVPRPASADRILVDVDVPRDALHQVSAPLPICTALTLTRTAETRGTVEVPEESKACVRKNRDGYHHEFKVKKHIRRGICIWRKHLRESLETLPVTLLRVTFLQDPNPSRISREENYDCEGDWMGGGEREIPEKTHRPTASSGTIPTCESPLTRPGIEPGSPWWEASGLAAQPPQPSLTFVMSYTRSFGGETTGLLVEMMKCYVKAICIRNLNAWHFVESGLQVSSLQLGSIWRTRCELDFSRMGTKIFPPLFPVAEPCKLNFRQRANDTAWPKQVSVVIKVVVSFGLTVVYMLMARQRELSEFERGMIVGARRMGHSISEAVGDFQYFTFHSVTCTGNIHINALRSTVDSTVAVQSYLIVIGGGWIEFSVLTELEHLLKSQPHSMQEVSEIVHLLTARHRAQRLTWAREVADWTLEDWKHVAWSYESRCRLFRVDSRVQDGGGSVMVWGVLTWHGMGPLVHLPTKLKGNCYKTLLGNHLQPFMDISFPDNDGKFQRGNAPSHRAVDVNEWFEEHSVEFQ